VTTSFYPIKAPSTQVERGRPGRAATGTILEITSNARSTRTTWRPNAPKSRLLGTNWSTSRRTAHRLIRFRSANVFRGPLESCGNTSAWVLRGFKMAIKRDRGQSARLASVDQTDARKTRLQTSLNRSGDMIATEKKTTNFTPTGVHQAGGAVEGGSGSSHPRPQTGTCRTG
jgi:hypothetical protein